MKRTLLLLASLAIIAACLGIASAGKASHKTFVDTPRSRVSEEARDEAINNILQGITDLGEGAMFASTSALWPVIPKDRDIDTWTYGNISRENTLRFGSISKIFTGYLGLKRGKLNLLKRVTDYGISSSEYPGANTVRLSHVYSHMSGIPEYANEKLINMTADPIDWNFGGDFTDARNVELGWKGYNLDFAPGSQYCYSNTNFELVSVAIMNNTGKSTSHHLAKEFGNVASSLKFDDGTTPAGSWPSALGYQDWPYPATMPGAAGSLIGKVTDVIRGYKHVMNDFFRFHTMQIWHNGVRKCDGPGAEVVAGSAYGFALQRYDTYNGRLVGHDSSLISRSILVFHASTKRIYFLHYTQNLDNALLMSTINSLIALF